MPLIPTSTALAAARLAQKDVVRAKWRALQRVLTADEIQQMQREMEEADSAAIAAWITANAIVVVAVSGPTGTGGVT